MSSAAEPYCDPPAGSTVNSRLDASSGERYTRCVAFIQEPPVSAGRFSRQGSSRGDANAGEAGLTGKLLDA